MNNNRQITDIYSDGYFLHKDRYLFKVYDDLEIYEIIDPVRLKELRKSFMPSKLPVPRVQNQKVFYQTACSLSS
ncbi:MAG: hypothetical protein U0T81_02840 [Saprospiraceae bacterium]